MRTAAPFEPFSFWHKTCVALHVRFFPYNIWVFVICLSVAEPTAQAAADLPIEFREGLLWMEVNVPQSKKPLHFLLDSGASASVVNLSTARQLALELGPKVSVRAVGRTVRGHWPVKLSAKASQLELPNSYLALDLGPLSDACNRSVDGLIGADFFRDRVVKIDYLARKLRVLDAATGEGDAHGLSMEVRPCGLRVQVSVDGGKNQWVRVDTGCATALQWVTSRARANRCTKNLAVGLSELSIPQTMTGVRIGNHFLDTVPTGLHRQPIFPGESGLLGNGLLAQFGTVTIDAISGRLILGRPPVN